MGKADEGGVFPHDDQPAGIAVGERPEQESFCSAEKAVFAPILRASAAIAMTKKAGMVPELPKTVLDHLSEAHKL